MGDRPLLHLVFPRWGGTGLHLTFGHRMPPMALLVLSAHARRHGWRVRVIDENFEPIPAERPDLAALTAWTSTAPQAYRIADRYRSQGVPVVLGGVHPSLLPDEALRHADAVLCGEADDTFPTVLADAAAGRLQPLYRGHWQGMDIVPTVDEWADILASWPITRYAPLNTVQTTRGCRFNCDFCSVIRINGRGSRHRPPEQVVEELRILKRRGQHVGGFTYVFFLDDDLAADLDYAADLLETMERSRVKVTWGAQASIGLARNAELLDLAARSGCRALFTGFESVSRESLIECNKKNRPSQYAELIEAVHQRGISVEGGFIFGFDHDGPDVFDETADFVDRIGVDVAHFSILTPYPGTHTFSRMMADGRITSFDWRRYNLYQAVFDPARMTALELEQGLRRAYRRFYRTRPRLARVLRESRRRDPRFGAALAVAGQNYATHYRRPTCSPDAGYEASAEDLARLALASAAPAQESLGVAFAGADAFTRGGTGAALRPVHLGASVPVVRRPALSSPGGSG
ncbi:MAG: B12-binding domain-containing radical SAM protein [Actinomycetota bacterium]|nr:B12-binding domain-containing radical SAM protein [Actinomycetota bacterium]